MSTSSESSLTRPPRSIWPMFIGGFILMLLFYFGTHLLQRYGDREKSYDELRAQERIEIRNRVMAEADKALHEYAWIDSAQGVVQLPVQRAMELTVAAMAQNNVVRPAGFIDPLKALAQPSAEPSTAVETAQPAQTAPSELPPSSEVSPSSTSEPSIVHPENSLSSSQPTIPSADSPPPPADSATSEESLSPETP